jgi:hypothetical protein
MAETFAGRSLLRDCGNDRISKARRNETRSLSLMSAPGDIVQEIISIMRQVASGPPPGQDPLDDDMPGG